MNTLHYNRTYNKHKTLKFTPDQAGQFCHITATTLTTSKVVLIAYHLHSPLLRNNH
ncbi:hypothetical protein THERMOS_1406 [Bathymodiolus thermophilus thioautotrophic gill symbiont]|uniref:Uncharacterized protein n=1 Tax=Bathymodiolus thermophilus thioautotrophic gill symbiont TaxID=2360 RepID=A0A8H9CFX9_9GAMM|nr:hypothetical protein THERMOS_1406 [Bathymodiolus thermophilus thioautotrophic gill symbiont]